jgi:hypothetical protein
MADVTSTHKIKYQANVELAIQQKRSEFERAFTFHPDMRGRTAQVLDLIGATAAIRNAPRGGDTPNIEGPFDQVYMRPEPLEWGRIIEKEDEIKAITEFESAYVQSGAAAIVRGKDDMFAESVFSSKWTGQDGTVSTPYSNAGRLVAEGVGSVDDVTATGMNVKKIIRAHRLLKAAQVQLGEEVLFLGLNAKEVEDLYRDITYVNTDYRAKAVLEEKRVLSILETTIIETERFPNLDVDTHRAFLWCKRGMHWGEFEPVTTQAERNPAKKYRLHPYIETWVGATRGEDPLVIEIHNKF